MEESPCVGRELKKGDLSTSPDGKTLSGSARDDKGIFNRGGVSG